MSECTVESLTHEYHLSVTHSSVLADLVSVYGLSLDWLSNVVATLGPTVLDLIKSALDNGFSKNFVVEVLEKLGPKILDVLIAVFGKTQMRLRSSTEVVSESVVEEAVLAGLFEQVLKMLFDKFGPQLVEVLVKVLLDALAKKVS